MKEGNPIFASTSQRYHHITESLSQIDQVISRCKQLLAARSSLASPSPKPTTHTVCLEPRGGKLNLTVALTLDYNQHKGSPSSKARLQISDNFGSLYERSENYNSDSTGKYLQVEKPFRNIERYFESNESPSSPKRISPNKNTFSFGTLKEPLEISEQPIKKDSQQLSSEQTLSSRVIRSHTCPVEEKSQNIKPPNLDSLIKIEEGPDNFDEMLQSQHSFYTPQSKTNNNASYLPSTSAKQLDSNQTTQFQQTDRFESIRKKLQPFFSQNNTRPAKSSSQSKFLRPAPRIPRLNIHHRSKQKNLRTQLNYISKKSSSSRSRIDELARSKNSLQSSLERYIGAKSKDHSNDGFIYCDKFRREVEQETINRFMLMARTMKADYFISYETLISIYRFVRQKSIPEYRWREYVAQVINTAKQQRNNSRESSRMQATI